MKTLARRRHFTLVTALLLALLAPTAEATIIVTSTDDSGAGTLREAIANATVGETINFDAALGNQTITLTSAPLTLTRNVTIEGPIGARVTISGNHERRVFVVESSVSIANLKQLIIANGKFLNTSNVPVEGGGGIYNKGRLTLTDCTVTGNEVIASRGVYNFGGGIFNDGDLALAGATVSSNSVSGPTVNRGGGITNYIDANLTIATTTISENETSGGPESGNSGAGLHNEGGNVYMIDSAITGNTCTAAAGGNGSGGGTGAGLLSNGDGNGADVVITNSAITNNAINGPGFTAGGGVNNANGSVLTISRTTISGNSVNGSAGGGGGILAQAPLTIVDSTISNNTAQGVGGGIWMTEGPVVLSNSTVARNSTVGSSGGGIANYGGTLDLIGSTIASNSATGSTHGGGGIFVTGSNAVVRSKNTIIAGNATVSIPATQNTAAFYSPDISGSLTSQGHNLIGDMSGATIVGDTTGNVLNQQPRLGPLADKGGLTKTMKLLGHAALNRGTNVTTLAAAVSTSDTTVTVVDASAFPAGVGVILQIDGEQMYVNGRTGNTLAVDRCFNSTTAAAHDGGAAVNPAFDQRGFGYPRKSGSAPDIGAFELQSTIVTNTADAGAGSLRAAIGAPPSADKAITFEIPMTDPNYDSSTGVYTITLTSGELAVAAELSILGPGADALTISGNQASRVFNVAPGANLTLAGLTIADGKSPDFEHGGGVLNRGRLTINDSVIAGCVAAASSGGAIMNFMQDAAGSLAMTNSILSGNQSGPGASNGGGIAIFVRPINSAASFALTVRDSAITNNTSGADGGGGIYMSVTGTEGFAGSLTMLLEHSTISGNVAGGNAGGGMFVAATGSDASTFTQIDRTTFSGNSVTGSTGNVVAGGGLFVWARDSASLVTQITNSTVSGNASDFGGGVCILGGSSLSTVTQFQNSTVTRNAATEGGGITTRGTVTTTLANAVVAGNTSPDGTTPNDISGTIEATSSYNLLGTGGSGGLTNGTHNNKIVANPLLAPLGNYGDATQTHAPLPGSAAINAGTSTAAPASDQRGVNRVGAVDIGAFESRGFNIIEASGFGQNAKINSAFAMPLVATVTSAFGEPVVGGAVTFTAPASGASAKFSGSNPFTATIALNGTSSAAPTANGTVGSYTVTAGANGVAGTATFNLQNTKLDQTITFAQLPDKTFGDADFDVSATATSGLPVSFTITGGNCTMVDANTVRITGAGNCSLNASQAGNDSYNPAPELNQFFNISRADQVITFAAPANKTYGNAPFDVNATSSSGLPVIFQISGPATISGKTVTITGAGTVTVTASQGGDVNYKFAPDVARSFTVAKAASVLTLTSSANPAKAGDVLTFTATLSSSATGAATGNVSFKANGNVIGVPQTFAADRTASLQTDALRAGTHVISAEHSGDENFLPAAATLPNDQVINPRASQPLNVSTRLNVLTGENVLIGGFFVTGNAPKKVIIRAIGPSLTADGAPLPGRLQDTQFELFDGTTGETVGTNDDWKTDAATGRSQQAEVESTTVSPTSDHESALVRTLNPGPYTAIVSGKDGSTGIALVEVFDLDMDADSQFGNISTRGFVDTGNNVMIGGFILGGSDGGSTVLVRGIGPSLGGISNKLQDPRLELYDANGEVVAANDDWKMNEATGHSQQALVEATTIPPSNESESAILITLQPGAYTAVLAGKGGATGVGLVELYNLR